MSRPQATTKRVRLLARVRDIEDKLERLVPDLEDGLDVPADEAWARIVGIREALEEE